MAVFLDARIPVLVTRAPAAPGPEDALLVEADAAGPEAHPASAGRFTVAASGHTAGCACCPPRSEVARALTRLFQARARGETPFFRQVVVVVAGEEGAASVGRALREDPLVSACYRAAPPETPGA
ncbi:MAG TPA: hypothetical protein VMI52_11110 [Acetobacteraceae bacterium]|nr:hypothetical protein [Acetobacteraceae bacterium]